MNESGAAVGVSAANPRRRYLTIMFSDLSDSTRLAGAMEAENYSDLLAQLRQAYRLVVPRHGGTIVRIQGDGLLAIFGFPTTLEDDGRRATEAALELHDRVRNLRPSADAPPLALHTGIHAGLVLLEEGDDIRGRFDPLGNAPNVAARLAEAAARDEILVSAETLGSESHFFRTEAPRTLSLKGVARPTTCLRVLGRAPTRTRLEARTRRGVAPFVGRDAQLRTLARALDEAVGGQPRCMALAGAPGLGKTRLAEEFLHAAAARGWHVMRGYCESYLGAEPLQPILQMLRTEFSLQPGMPAEAATRALDDALERIAPALRSHRGELLRVLSLAAASDASAADTLLLPAQAPTRAALCEVFEALAARRPLLVFVDDWQWADDITKQVVEAICQLRSRPVMVLIATRGFEPGEADMLNATLVRMNPLDERESAEIVGRLLPRADPFVVSRIQRSAGGNPLFIEELCHFDGVEYRPRSGQEAVAGAAWLNRLIESRVARLPGDQLDVVHCAAVIGSVVPAWLLHGLTGVDEHHPLIRRLSEQDLLFPGDHPGTLRFKHGITRDVVYAAIGLRERRALHRAVAEAIARQRPGASEEAVEMLAYHYGAAGLPQEAADFAELAGDKAIAGSALDRAKEQYRAALAALDQCPPSAERDARWNAVAERLGLACVFDPAREDLRIFERAVQLATQRGGHGTVARARYWLGYVHYALGESGPAIHHCDIALEEARAFGSDPLIVQISATLGQIRAAACDYDAALALLDDASRVKRRFRSGTRPAVGLAYTLACKGSILGDRGQFRSAHLCFDEAMDAVRGAAHEVEGSVLCWRAAVHLWQGLWVRARDDALAARRIAERVKSLYVFAMSQSLGAYADWILERDADALRRLADATSWLEQRDKALFISLNYGWLAEGLAGAGRFDEARRSAARAIARARKHDRIGEAVAYRALAAVALAGRARRPADEYLQRALQAAALRASPRERALTRLAQADAAVARGALAAANDLLAECAAAFHELAMPWHLEEVERRRAALRDRTPPPRTRRIVSAV